MAKSHTLKVAVLGGGPVGLEAALYAQSLGLDVTLYEHGQPGEHIGRWGFVRMFTPFGMNTTTLGKKAIRDGKSSAELPSDTAIQTGREFRDTYLSPLAQCPALKEHIRTQTAVLSIGRTGWRKSDPVTRSLPPFRLLLRSANNQESFNSADVVLDCTGVLHKPNWIGDGGIPAAGEAASRQHIPYWVEDVRGAKKAHYAGKSVIVIGGGHSAAATVCDLMELAAENQTTWVIWLARGSRTQPVIRMPNDPIRDRDRLAVKANGFATRCDGNLEYHLDSRIIEVASTGPDKGYRVVTQSSCGQTRTWEAERLIANVGFKPDQTLTAELRVTEPDGDVTTGEPGYYILGAKCHGRRSGFLLRDAHDQIRRVFAGIQGNARLDLYTKAA